MADELRDRSSRPKTMEDLRRSVEYSILAPGRTREEQLEYRSCERLLEDAGFRAGRVEVELVRKSASISQNLARTLRGSSGLVGFDSKVSRMGGMIKGKSRPTAPMPTSFQPRYQEVSGEATERK